MAIVVQPAYENRQKPRKGRRTRAYVYFCVGCDTEQTVYAIHRNVDSSEADRYVRAYGWSKTADGWKCQSCK